MKGKQKQPNGPRRERIPKSLRDAVLRRDGYRCRIPGCNRRLLLTCDHIIPVSHGGATIMSNLRAVCRPHNSARGNRALRTASNGYAR